MPAKPTLRANGTFCIDVRVTFALSAEDIVLHWLNYETNSCINPFEEDYDPREYVNVFLGQTMKEIMGIVRDSLMNSSYQESYEYVTNNNLESAAELLLPVVKKRFKFPDIKVQVF